MAAVTRRITKIKAKKGEYFFIWEVYQESTKSWDVYSLSCKDAPREELKERLKDMIAHVVEICELSEGDADRIIVGGISESHSEDNRYVTITAQKRLEYSHAPMIINTPARPELPSKEDADSTYCMSEELVADLEALEDEAWRYIHGDRAQTKLAFEEAGKEEKESA
ncbi:hypothetical protein TAMA11512_13010 [Selenomonas sp. TAMA-11512]|uniref:hypothetical protein n=1 Tax=Selenomonas sp. TAMA-11512 TaxID=3095337 RepID=UPI00308E6BBC|nr:hypothetical protein TAMA11512_13010 [Selenomonas sp. TAMA-11512]